MRVSMSLPLMEFNRVAGVPLTLSVLLGPPPSLQFVPLPLSVPNQCPPSSLSPLQFGLLPFPPSVWSPPPPLPPSVRSPPFPPPFSSVPSPSPPPFSLVSSPPPFSSVPSPSPPPFSLVPSPLQVRYKYLELRHFHSITECLVCGVQSVDSGKLKDETIDYTASLLWEL